MKVLEAAFSREIEDPDNSKRDNDRSDAETEYKPDVMTGYTLPSLPRWYYWALLRTLGRTHDVLLIMRPGPFELPNSFICPTTANVTDIGRVPHVSKTLPLNI